MNGKTEDKQLAEWICTSSRAVFKAAEAREQTNRGGGGEIAEETNSGHRRLTVGNSRMRPSLMFCLL